ncbi:MAG: hypothetical protein JWQ04_2838 [Pedosphaera sp.]|nr:hypothetical protein [Pedosphaera sp.]
MSPKVAASRLKTGPVSSSPAVSFLTPDQLAAWKAAIDAQRAAAALLPPPVLYTNNLAWVITYDPSITNFVLLQGSTNLTDWQDLGQFPPDVGSYQTTVVTSNQYGFYRVLLGASEPHVLTNSP